MLKIALMGAGNHSRDEHAPAIAKFNIDHPGLIELTAVCDKDLKKAESFCSRFGFKRAYTDLGEMFLEEKPDGCICIMPVNLIADVGVQVMRYRIPVLLEKPLGANLKEVRNLSAIAKETGTFNLVSVNRRFNSLLRRALEWSQHQGSLRYVRGSILRHERCESDFIWATAIHSVDALREIAGDVANFKFSIINSDVHLPKWYHLDLEFVNNIRGCLDVIPTRGSSEEKYEMFGQDFRIEVCLGQYVHGWKNCKVELEEYSDVDEPGFVKTGTYGETVEFINALLEKKCPRPSIEDVVQSAEICFAMT